MLLALLVGVLTTHAATISPAFTFQGRLTEGTGPATGEYEMRFSLHPNSSGIQAFGEAITNGPVTVVNGFFTVLLDFGPDAFDGNERWLSIGVRTNGTLEEFTVLDPRQPISATPYALFASNAGAVTGAIDASQIASGTLPPMRLSTNVALLNANQEFTQLNSFSAGVTINPTGDIPPLIIVGGNQIPHVRVSTDSNTTAGAVFSLNTSGQEKGQEYYFYVAGGTAAEDTGKLIIRNETLNRNLMIFSTNNFVGINQSSPTNRLHVGGKVSATGFVGGGSELTGLSADAITSGTLSGARMNTNVALLNRNNQMFSGNNRFEGSVITGTGASDNVELTAVGQPDRGAVQVKNETSTVNARMIAAANGGRIDVANPSGEIRATFLTESSGGGTVRTHDSNGEITAALYSNNNGGQVDVRNANGENRASMFISDDKSGVLSLTGKNGTANIVGGYVNSDRPNYGAMSLNDNVGDSKVWMAADEDGAGKLFTYGNNGSFNVTLGTGADESYGGVNTWGPDGTSTTALYSQPNGGTLDIRDLSGNARASMHVNGNGTGEINLRGTNGNSNVLMTHTSNLDHGFVGVYDSAGTPKASMYVADDGMGWVVTDAIQINGGADIAEPFQVRPSDLDLGHKIEPGMLVAIDPDRAGELRLSSQAYDRTVAGIISGAGGVNTGMTLQHKGTMADGDHPVALTGRVWCYVDADAGAIRPGDLLTTSEVPGHAMKVTDHDRAQGAIVGKAMTKLEHGRGLVLVLVSLQ